MTKVLHVTPHLGGGCGIVLGNLTAGAEARGEVHEFLLLEQPGEDSMRRIAAHGLDYSVIPVGGYKNIFEQSRPFDVVQVEFWNHPLLYHFLSSCALPDRPAVIHCHIQGSTPPQFITAAAAGLFDYLVSTTPSTLANTNLDSIADDRKRYIPSGLAKNIPCLSA